MSREATVVTLGARRSLALPEKQKRESRGQLRSEVEKTKRRKFHADPSEGERITDFGDDAEVQSDRICVVGSFDKIAYAAGPFAVGVAEVADCYSEGILELLLRGGDFFFRLVLWNRRQARMAKRVGAELLAGREPLTRFRDVHESVACFAARPTPHWLAPPIASATRNWMALNLRCTSASRRRVRLPSSNVSSARSRLEKKLRHEASESIEKPARCRNRMCQAKRRHTGS
jgi:hypothetical protein